MTICDPSLSVEMWPISKTFGSRRTFHPTGVTVQFSTMPSLVSIRRFGTLRGKWQACLFTTFWGVEHEWQLLFTFTLLVNLTKKSVTRFKRLSNRDSTTYVYRCRLPATQPTATRVQQPARTPAATKTYSTVLSPTRIGCVSTNPTSSTLIRVECTNLSHTCDRLLAYLNTSEVVSVTD